MGYQPTRFEPVATMVSAFAPTDFMVAGLDYYAPSSATWYSANGAVYTPVFVPGPCVIRRVWWVNGSTVSASYNIDCGVYQDAGQKPGAKLVSSGSTAQGTATNVQFVDVTDTSIGRGLYWLALSCSSASATIFRDNIGLWNDASMMFVEASAVPLPATATPVETTTQSLPLFGFATTASP